MAKRMGDDVDQSTCEEQLMLRSDSISWPKGRTENLSAGSYGAVYPVKVHGFTCIAKRLYAVLREAGHADTDEPTVSDKFMQECKLLSTLHHPNIVQFMGIHETKDSAHPQDVSLIMEGLHTDLDKFLENNKDVPLSLKLSFLLDVSNALVYLHLHTPPIIHRDVKAANVLLARDMRAKLADLGTSKLLPFNPLSSTKFTKCPGTLGIMPPEALQSEPKYGTKLDVFSFGTLILHTVNQEFPLPCEVDKAKKKGELQITKRQAAMDKLNKHPLHDVTRKCLQDYPDKRPNMAFARDELERRSQEHPCSFTTFYDMYQETEKLKRELNATHQWSVRMDRLAKENGRLQIEIQKAREECQLAEAQAALFKEDFEREREDRERAAGSYDSDRRRLEAEKEELHRELQFEKASRIRLQNEMKQLQEQERERVHKMKHPAKTVGARSSATLPIRKRTFSNGSGLPAEADLLQSLRFNSAQHSSAGQRCSQRYEWYQTPSDVVLEIMIPNVKEDDIVVEFTDKKVKVFIDTGASPYRLSLHTSHKIMPDKCLMKCLRTKVELKMKKAEGVHWITLDERGIHTSESLDREISRPTEKPELSEGKTLPTFDVLAEKTVVVTNEEQDIIWEGYGLKLHIPSNSLPEGRSQCRLKVEVGLSGEFELPENGVLVSAVYSFSHDLRDGVLLRQPVTLKMEHCATASAVDNLSIVRANTNSNTFHLVPGGDFSSVEGYAVIKLHSFSRFSTFLKKHFSFLLPQSSNPIEYSANIYYTYILHLQFNFEFFIIKNLGVLAKTVEAEISKRVGGHYLRGPFSNFKFQENVAVSLEIPESCGDGWRMKELNPFEVTKEDVDRYTAHKELCPCQVKVWWESEGAPKQLAQKVTIKGAKKEYNFLTVTTPPRCLIKPVSPSTPASPISVVIPVKPKLSELSYELKGLPWSDVESVAVQLEVDYDELLKIQQQTVQATNRMHQAFNIWLKTDSDASWEKVISALERVSGKDVLVQRLREKYLPQSPGQHSTSQYSDV